MRKYWKVRKRYGRLSVYKQIFMKKYTLFLLASLLSTMAFAQILPDNITGGQSMSGEIVLNSAPSMSDEIDIALPFDPLEVENKSGSIFPPFSLNSATNVQTGAGSIIVIMLAILLGTALYGYKVRTQKDS